MTRILVVEDEGSSARALQYYLETKGHEIRMAARSEEAIEIGRDFRPEVLLTDIFLSDQHGGIHVAETLSEEDPRLQILLMSGLPEMEVRRRSAHLDVVRLCLKPLSLADVSEAIEQAAARRANAD